MNYRSILLVFLLSFVIKAHTHSVNNPRNFSFQDTTKVKKKEGAIARFFNSIFHHNDSAKQARKFIHQHHKLLKDKTPSIFAKKDGNVKPILFKTPKDFKLGYEVFGWYPYWEKEYYKNINFDLLSTVAYFSYEVNPKTGNAISVHDWETTGLIDSIKAHNKKVLLTVSNFGLQNNRRFLKRSDAIDTLINNLIKLLAKRQANGICIDFEGVSSNEKTEYTNFLLVLSNRLKSANKDYQIYITVPNVNWSDAIDFKAIEQAVDRFVIMGYDYYGKGSKVAGPVAPIESGKTWEPFNLSNSIKYYSGYLPSSKIILALPTYGTIWETKDLNIASKVKKYIGSRTFSYIKTNIENNTSVYIDPISKSAYSAYKIKGNNGKYRQCWYENDSSFSAKVKLVKEHKLKGLGLWALGYDKGYNDYWEVISKEMEQIPSSNNSSSIGSNSSTAKDSTKTSSPSLVSHIVNTLGLTDPNSKINKVEKKLVTITNYKAILLYIMSFVLFFACIGFVIAILSPNTRAVFFNNNTFKKFYIAITLLLSIVVFRMLHWIDNGSILLIIGFVLGAYSFYAINKMMEEKQKDLP